MEGAGVQESHSARSVTQFRLPHSPGQAHEATTASISSSRHPNSFTSSNAPVG